MPPFLGGSPSTFCLTAARSRSDAGPPSARRLATARTSSRSTVRPVTSKRIRPFSASRFRKLAIARCCEDLLIHHPSYISRIYPEYVRVARLLYRRGGVLPTGPAGLTRSVTSDVIRARLKMILGYAPHRRTSSYVRPDVNRADTKSDVRNVIRELTTMSLKHCFSSFPLSPCASQRQRAKDWIYLPTLEFRRIVKLCLKLKSCLLAAQRTPGISDWMLSSLRFVETLKTSAPAPSTSVSI